MDAKVYQAIQRFEREVQTRFPHVQLSLIDPLAGADASFEAAFPTIEWYEALGRLTEIAMDIEEETDVFITLLPVGTQPIAEGMEHEA